MDAAATLPAWTTALEEDDWQFVRRFVLGSGSLKDLALAYGVSYPTVRARLDRLIAKIAAAEDPAAKDPFERKLRMLVADAQLSVPVARQLLAAHRETTRKRGPR